jgi:hypothetical protein
LRNRGGKLFHKTGIATLFGGFKNSCQFHTRRLSHLPTVCGRGRVMRLIVRVVDLWTTGVEG